MPKKSVSQRDPPGLLTNRVVSLIREMVGAGKLAPGQYVPSERDLAEKLDVSRVTVRRGFDQLVRDGFLAREPGRGYCVPKPGTFSHTRSGQGRTAIVFIHDHTEAELAAGTYHAQMWTGVREEASRAGFLTMISSMPASQVTDEKAADLARVAAGVLCDHPNPDVLPVLRRAGIPAVQVDYYREDGASDYVVQDDTGGIVHAVRYLAAAGHRRIGYLDTVASLRPAGIAANAEHRRAGFLLGCERHGVPAENIAAADWHTGEAAAATAILIASGVTALVVPHRELWPDVKRALAAHHIAIPGSFGLVVWGEPAPDDAVACAIPYITWSKEQMGREAARRLIARMARPDLDAAGICVHTTLRGGK
jgi:DNA-binding LacI/PurR family transcriptional regulator